MDEKIFKRRVFISGLIILIISVFIVIKLFTLHFTEKIIIPKNGISITKRGYIKDRNGYLLAISIETDSLFANNEKINNPGDVASAISRIIGMPPPSIKKKLLPKKKFIWIKRKIRDSQSREIRKLKIDGLYFKKEYKRLYPYGNLASNLIGFVGVDNSGLDGVEYHYDSILSPRDDTVLNNSNIRVGKTISLTIDRFIQYSSEMIIKKAVKRLGAKQGVVVVMEVKTGRILALAKYPNFDPNQYYKFSSQARRNYSVIDSFEPGSTLKIISTASILEKKPALVNQKYLCKGKIKVEDIEIKCTGSHGLIDFNSVLKNSCNVGIIKAISKIKKSDLYGTLRRFGFGKKIDLGLPGESEGILRPVGKWSGVSKQSISIGYEISVTSLQLVAAFGAIANGGIYIAPSIIESIDDYDEDNMEGYKPRIIGRVINAKIAKRLMKLMRVVVSKGTGSKASSKYFKVVGKTGTARKFSRGKRMYTNNVLSSFIGIAPYENPEACILVIIDEPRNSLSGGKAAAPLFKEVVDAVLPKMGAKNEMKFAKQLMRSKKRKFDFSGNAMPNFKGLGLHDSIRLLTEVQKSFDINYILKGTGMVYAQKPLPGRNLGNYRKIILYFKER
ncbi:penicillin-binding transpeptidase domain-containing protein [Spirochaetota bacterium]